MKEPNNYKVNMIADVYLYCICGIVFLSIWIKMRAHILWTILQCSVAIIL